MAYVIVTPRGVASDVYDRRGECWTPAVDIIETDTSYHIQLDMPGFGKDDFKIVAEDDELTVTAERHRQEPEKEEYFRYFERPVGRLTRSFTLPDAIDIQNVNATYKDGVLTIELRKKEESKPQIIPVGESKQS